MKDRRLTAGRDLSKLTDDWQSYEFETYAVFQVFNNEVQVLGEDEEPIRLFSHNLPKRSILSISKVLKNVDAYVTNFSYCVDNRYSGDLYVRKKELKDIEVQT